MNRLLAAGLVLQFAALPALAQAPPPSPPAATAPAPLTPAAPTAVIPDVQAPKPGVAATATVPPAVTTGGLQGANSFTEGQARTRLETDGYTNVVNLMKDKDGIWRGMATKNAKQAAVGVDFKGNVVTQ
jgi:hypothetical protein